MTVEEALLVLAKDENHQVLKRVPEMMLDEAVKNSATTFNALVVDLETMGLNPKADEILEIGILSFAFDKANGIIGVTKTYNELQQPSKPIPEEITKITGISDEDVKGKNIDWQHVSTMLENAHLIICHNSSFDRNFLELQTPKDISEKIKSLPFACTLKDIDWQAFGFESSKLDYLNWKLGYFYKGHRALTDCYATYNLLFSFPKAFEALKERVRSKDVLLCASYAPFDKKDLLKERKYRWSDGSGNLPKAWYSTIPFEEIEKEHSWLDELIYERNGMAKTLPQAKIGAKERFSLRAEKLLEA